MKIMLLVCAVLVFTSCQPSGKIIPPPDGMENTVKQYLSTNYKMQEFKSLTVRKFPQETFLVTANFVKQGLVKTYDSSVQLIAQPANNQGQQVWQVRPASEQELKTYKIK